jgi:oligoendopeptidase F
MRANYTISFAIGLLMVIALPLNGQSNIPQRADIADEYKWNLEDIYTSIAEWEADYLLVESQLDKFSDFKGKLKKSGKTILACFELDEELSMIIEDLYVYAYLNKDLDTRVSDFQGLADRAAALNIKYGEAVAYIEPELQEIPENRLNRYIKSTSGLEIYRHYFDNLFRQREHTLSSEEEELLAMAGELYRSPSKIHEALTEADLVFPMVKGEDGEMIQLTRGRYQLMLLSNDPEVRRRAFLGRTEAFDKIKNTNAAVFGSSLKKDLFLARARKYNSSLEMALGVDNIPVDVYDKLIKTVFDHAGSLQRYMELRKTVLGLEEIHLYDTSVPIVEDVEVKVTYEEAGKILEKAYAPMGEEYVSIIKKALTSRWIDVYETEGKATGAYSWGTYNSHPYILMNYNGTQDHMFTLSHELGHAMHSYYSGKNQPYPTADYTLFVAEVASTFNENLLLDYLMKNTDDEKEKLVLLDQWINNFLGTVFTQVIWSEFERSVHQMLADGTPLTVESLSKVSIDTDKKWYGDDVIIDKGYALNWGRIPHYYRAFYVYKYATSFCASTALAKGVLDGKEGSHETFLTFLKSGGNDYPIELLKKAGVDMSSPDPVEQAMQLFDSLVLQMEELLLN